MPAIVELADKYGVKYDTDNPVPVSATIDTTGLATSANQDTAITHLEAIELALETPASSIPHGALDATSDLTRVYDDGSTAAEESLVAAVSGQTTRVYEIRATSAGAGYIELRNGSGGAVLRRITFPAAGAWEYSFRSRPYAVTGTNTALYWYRSAAVAMTIEAEYVTAV